jgi:methionyl-tRNA formyltransferase
VSLRIGLVGAVWSTEVALRTLAAAGHRPVRLFTLPVEKRGRHSDFVDLGGPAEELGVPVSRADDVNRPEVLDEVRKLALDVLLVVGWSRICGPEFRQLARLGTLGYHPTLLPKMRGRAALAWTILLAPERSGGTLFWLDEGVDSGPIAAQEAFPLDPDVALPELVELHKQALARMIPPLFASLAAGEVPSRLQDHGEATYLAVRRPDHGEIGWGATAGEIERLVRATSRPYPGAFTSLGGRKLRVWSARVVRRPEWVAQTGQVFTIDEGAPVVRCGGDTDLALIDYELADSEAEGEARKLLARQPVLGR